MVYIFTVPNCPACRSLKNQLTELDIGFHEIDTTKNNGIWREVNRQNGKECLIPTIFVPTDKNGNGDLYCPEQHFNTIEEIISILTTKMNIKK